MQTVLLSNGQHDRSRFDCGEDDLNNYLKIIANQQSKRDNSRTFVLENIEDPSQIVGFYTLTMATIDLSALPTKLKKKHSNTTSAGLIARLAVDKRFKGQRIGEWLLIDALQKLLSASDTVGFPLVIVDAKDGVEGFYQQYGFNAFADESNRLFMTVADIRASFSNS